MFAGNTMMRDINAVLKSYLDCGVNSLKRYRMFTRWSKHEANVLKIGPYTCRTCALSWLHVCFIVQTPH